jgi:hypothetical protein
MDALIPMAILYDFDGTLAPGNMQEHGFIPAIGVTPEAFWTESFELAREQDADTILAYMRLMLGKAEAAGVRITRESFRAFGSTLELYPGVEGWFARINSYGRSRGVGILHFIVSSGLREMIEGTSIAGEFQRVFASGYMYDSSGAAVWPALAVNYTTKTQFLFRINKGSLDVFDNTTINKRIPREERPLPFSNMVYIGDGETDVPCFRLTEGEGGTAIAVFEPGDAEAEALARRILAEGRASIAAPADYREGGVLDASVKAIVDAIAAGKG